MTRRASFNFAAHNQQQSRSINCRQLRKCCVTTLLLKAPPAFPCLALMQAPYSNTQTFAVYPQLADTRGFAIRSGADFPAPATVRSTGGNRGSPAPSLLSLRAALF